MNGIGEMPLLSASSNDPQWLSIYHAINWVVQVKPDSMVCYMKDLK